MFVLLSSSCVVLVHSANFDWSFKHAFRGSYRRSAEKPSALEIEHSSRRRVAKYL
jgi:hypothetical protein